MGTNLKNGSSVWGSPQIQMGTAWTKLFSSPFLLAAACRVWKKGGEDHSGTSPSSLLPARPSQEKGGLTAEQWSPHLNLWFCLLPPFKRGNSWEPFNPFKPYTPLHCGLNSQTKLAKSQVPSWVPEPCTGPSLYWILSCELAHAHPFSFPLFKN